MKYLIVIPAALAQAAPQGSDTAKSSTALEAATTPTLDRLALMGRLGRATTCPPGLPAGADVGLLSLLGYDPTKTHTGRAALEALGLGHEVLPGDWVMRLSFLQVKGGVVDAVVPVHDAEAGAWLAGFASQFHLPGAIIRSGAGGRHMLVSPALSGAHCHWDALETKMPQEIIGKPLAKHMPKGGDLGPMLAEAIRASQTFLAHHEINLTRAEMGEQAVTCLWPWGQGRLPGLRPLPETLGLRVACVAEPGLATGLAKIAGMSVVAATPDGSPTALALAAGRALAENDLVVVHARLATNLDEVQASSGKSAAISAFDADFMAPVLKTLESGGQPWRILVAGDHAVKDGVPVRDPVPFLMAGHRVPHVVDARMTEAACAQSDLHVTQGHQLLEHFLTSGLGPELRGRDGMNAPSRPLGNKP